MRIVKHIFENLFGNKAQVNTNTEEFNVEEFWKEAHTEFSEIQANREAQLSSQVKDNHFQIIPMPQVHGNNVTIEQFSFGSGIDSSLLLEPEPFSVKKQYQHGIGYIGRWGNDFVICSQEEDSYFLLMIYTTEQVKKIYPHGVREFQDVNGTIWGVIDPPILSKLSLFIELNTAVYNQIQNEN